MWNWQHKNWPNFNYKVGLLEKVEQLFLNEQSIRVGINRYMEDAQSHRLLIDLMSTEAADSSAIEGELLNRNSIQASIQRQLGIKTTKVKASSEEIAIAELMSSVYLTISEPLSENMLCAWHDILTKHRRDLEDCGRYRTHSEEMLISSGPDYARKIHFVAPPSNTVAKSMGQFISWFNQTNEPLITKAAIAHLWFESIHPFEDGNGRIGRAISEKVLSASGDNHQFIILAQTLLKRRKEYYRQLGQASKSLDINDWLIWFASVCIEAQRNTLSHIDFIVEKDRLFNRAKDKLNQRQEKVILRLFKAGPEGFKGGLSADNYRVITGATTPTATRDLRDLVDKAILVRKGERKSTRYYLNVNYTPNKTVTVKEILQLAE